MVLINAAIEKENLFGIDKQKRKNETCGMNEEKKDELLPKLKCWCIYWRICLQ